MYCPVCHRVSHCPCDSCENQKIGKQLFIEDPIKETQKCPYCGFEENINWWFEYNISRALYFNGTDSLSNFNKQQSLININETRKSINNILLIEENRTNE